MKKRIKLQNKEGIPEEYNVDKVLVPSVDPEETVLMPGGIVKRGFVAYDETSDAEVLPEQMLEGCSGYAKGEKVAGTMQTAQIQLFVNEPNSDGEVNAYLYFKTATQQHSQFSGHIDESFVEKTLSLPVQAKQTYTPGTTDQVIVKEHWLLGDQTIKGDANLVPENIAEGVRIFGVTGTHEGVLPTGRIYIDSAFEYQEGQLAPKVWDVTDYAEAVVQHPGLDRWNIREGMDVLGLSGRLQSPAYAIGNGQPATRLWYNKQYPWGQILPNLEYTGELGEYSIALIGSALPANYDVLSFFIVAMKFGDNYAVLAGTNTVADVIYTTAPIHAELEDGDGNIIHIDADTPGWQGDYYEPEDAVYNVIFYSSIPDNLFASAEIAFGDWVKPTGTLTITQNGTYDVTNYAQIVVNVEGGGGDPVVDGKTLVFDDATSVDGKTLVLDTDAAIDGKTLSFGEAEEEDTVDGKDLVTSGSIDGKTAILDGHVEGKTLIL